MKIIVGDTLVKAITTYTAFVLVGIFIGYLLFHTTPVQQISVKEKTETIETSRSEEIKKEVEAVIPAEIAKEEAPANLVEKYFASEPEVKNEVARWDTITADGFEAHVKYFTKQNLFVNNFTYPEKIVYKTKTVHTTTDSTTVKLITEMPAFQLGGGVKTLYDNEFKLIPYCNLAANTKLWFLHATVEVRTLFESNNKITPEIEGKLSIGL